MSDQQSQDEPSMEEILASIRRIISEDDPEQGQGESEKAAEPGSEAQDPVAATEPAEAAEPETGADEVPDQEVPDQNEDDAEDELELTQKVNPDGSIDDLSAEPQEPAGSTDEDGAPKPKPIFDEAEPDPAAASEGEAIDQSFAETSASESDAEFSAEPQEDTGTEEEAPDITLEPEEQELEPEPDDDDMHDIGANSDDSLISEPTQAAASSALSEIAKAAITQRALAIGDGRTLEDLVREALRPELKLWLDTHLATLVERIVREEIKKMVRRVENQ